MLKSAPPRTGVEGPSVPLLNWLSCLEGVLVEMVLNPRRRGVRPDILDRSLVSNF